MTHNLNTNQDFTIGSTNTYTLMTPHPEFLRGIQAAIEHLEEKEKQYEERPLRTPAAPYRAIIIALERFLSQQSTPPSVADQKGGSNAD